MVSNAAREQVDTLQKALEYHLRGAQYRHQCFNYERSVGIWVGVAGIGQVLLPSLKCLLRYVPSSTLCPLYNPSAVWTTHRSLRYAPRVQHAICNGLCIHIRLEYRISSSLHMFLSACLSSKSIHLVVWLQAVQHNVAVRYPFRGLSCSYTVSL